MTSKGHPGNYTSLTDAIVAAGKAKMVVITAIAREMASFIWAIARATTPARA